MHRFFTICIFSIFGAGTPVVFGQALQPPTAPADFSQVGHGSQPAQGSTTTGSIIPSSTAKTPPDAVTPYNQGAALLKAKNYAAAERRFEASLKANPNLPQAHLLAAFCLRQLGPANYPASLRHLNAALKLDPNMGEAYESRGVLYVKMGKKEDAQKDLATLKQLNPKLTPGLEIALKTGQDVDHYQ
jgi:tetratricopeptide (TPR) repeat protein